ncbi:succinate dehydrogenase cytochrome b subunit [Candidatus Riflebacteria bacterium]
MNRLLRYFSSSIGSKQLMALTGFSLCAFLIVHLLGNGFLFVSAEAFNKYAYALTSNPLLIPAELTLFIIFALHIGLGLKLTLENWAARPVGYQIDASAGKQTIMSKTMWITGPLILVFIIIHLINFRFAHQLPVIYASKEYGNLFLVVDLILKNTTWATVYLLGFSALCLHVAHGFRSWLQSLGVNDKKYDLFLHQISYLYAVIVFIGFSMILLYLFFSKGGN